MGNQQSITEAELSQSIERDYQTIEKPYLIHRHTQQQYTLYKLITNSHQQTDRVLSNIQRYKSNNCGSITCLKDYFHRKNPSYCSDQQNFYFLFFDHGRRTLHDEYNSRRYLNMRFNNIEIYTILCSMLVGFKQYHQHFNRNIHGISLDSICIESNTNRIYVRQPWLSTPNTPISIFTQTTPQHPFTKLEFIYSSPQKLQSYRNDTDIIIDELSSNLFTIGIIALQLYHMEFIDDIYNMKTKQIHNNKLTDKIQAVNDKNLKEGLLTLLQNNPNRRKDIYRLWNISFQEVRKLQTLPKQQYPSITSSQSTSQLQITNPNHPITGLNLHSQQIFNNYSNIKRNSLQIQQTSKIASHLIHQPITQSINKPLLNIPRPDWQTPSIQPYLINNSFKKNKQKLQAFTKRNNYQPNIIINRPPSKSFKHPNINFTHQSLSLDKHENKTNTNIYKNNTAKPQTIINPNIYQLNFVQHQPINIQREQWKTNWINKPTQYQKTEYKALQHKIIEYKNNTNNHYHINNHNNANQHNNLNNHIYMNTHSNINSQYNINSNSKINNGSNIYMSINNLSDSNLIKKVEKFYPIKNNSEQKNIEFINKQSKNISTPESIPSPPIQQNQPTINQFNIIYPQNSLDQLYNKFSLKSIKEKPVKDIQIDKYNLDSNDVSIGQLINSNISPIHEWKKGFDENNKIYSAERDRDLVQSNDSKQQPISQTIIKQSISGNEENISIQQETKDNNQFIAENTPDRQPDRNKYNTTIVEVNQESPQISEQSIQGEEEYVVQEYQTGSKYQGFKVNGMRSGNGKFFYQDGGHYEGQWKNNKMHGWGKLYYEGGRIAYQGHWSQDQFHGYGKVYNDNPMSLKQPFDYTNFDMLDDYWEYYEGNLVSDTKEGRGKIKLTNRQVFEGDFHSDRIQGFGKYYTIDGNFIQGIWRDSKLIKILNSSLN